MPAHQQAHVPAGTLVGQQYQVQQETTLVLKEVSSSHHKMTGADSDNFMVTDTHGQLWFQVLQGTHTSMLCHTHSPTHTSHPAQQNAKMFSMLDQRQILDARGQVCLYSRDT